MIRILLLRFWPVLVAIALLLLWRWHSKRRVAQGKTALLYGDISHFTIAVIAVLVTIVCFVTLMFTQNYNIETKDYQPAQIKDGQFQPEHHGN